MDGTEGKPRSVFRMLGIGRGELTLAVLAVIGVVVFVLGIVLAIRLLIYLLTDVGPV